MFLIFASLIGTDKPLAPLAPYKKHADCNAFDRFMNVLCYRLGLIRKLE